MVAFNGLSLGAATALSGVLLDRQQDLLPETSLYVHGLGMALFNLLILGPVVYAHVPTRQLRKQRCMRHILQTFGLVGAHSALYSLVHRAMHKIKVLRAIHDPHHRFKEVVVPSAANAVMPAEFLLAYMTPFMIAAHFAPPSPMALFAAATIVSAFNLIVHTPSATKFASPHWWVHPNTHLAHHLTRAPHYAAPTFSTSPIPMLIASMSALKISTLTDHSFPEVASIFS